jgi:hypothetical protein
LEFSPAPTKRSFSNDRPVPRLFRSEDCAGRSMPPVRGTHRPQAQACGVGSADRPSWRNETSLRNTMPARLALPGGMKRDARGLGADPCLPGMAKSIAMGQACASQAQRARLCPIVERRHCLRADIRARRHPRNVPSPPRLKILGVGGRLRLFPRSRCITHRVPAQCRRLKGCRTEPAPACFGERI